MSATTDAPDLDVAEDDETGWDEICRCDGICECGTAEPDYREWDWADASGGGW